MKDSIKQGSSKFVTRSLSFLWWCSGGDSKILKDMPAEWHKYAGIGASILVGALLATLSSGYILYIVFESKLLAIVAAAIWGLVILNLERYIVSTMIRKQSFEDKLSYIIEGLLPLIPRIILAIVIAVIISQPLQVFMFSEQVNQQINKPFDETLQSLNGRIEVIEAELSSPNDTLQFTSKRESELFEAFVNEVDGTGGSGRYGYGAIARAKERAYRQAHEEYLNMKMNIEQQTYQKRTELTTLQIEKERLLKSKETQRITLLTMFRGLSELKAKDSSIALTCWGITFLIILVLTTPLLIKLLSQTSLYDHKLSLSLRETEEKANLPTNRINLEVQKAFKSALELSNLKPKK